PDHLASGPGKTAVSFAGRHFSRGDSFCATGRSGRNRGITRSFAGRECRRDLCHLLGTNGLSDAAGGLLPIFNEWNVGLENYPGTRFSGWNFRGSFRVAPSLSLFV